MGTAKGRGSHAGNIEAGARSQPNRRHRAILACALGTLVTLLIWMDHKPTGDYRTDFDETWYTSRGFIQKQNPYAVGDSLHSSGWVYPLIYPGTAVLVTAPFALMPLRLSRAAWIGVGTAGLVWVLTARGWWGLFALASASYLNALFLCQWSPLLIAGLIPGMGFVWAAKPNIGAALFAGWPSRAALIGSTILTLLSLLAIPGWLNQMAAGIGTAPHLVPMVSRPGGVLLLLALLRWREPRARLLAALAVVPHTTMVYEMLPLFLIPRTAREMTALTVLSQIAFTVAFTLYPRPAHARLGAMISAHWPVWFLMLYLPALWMVLRRPQPRADS